MTLQPSEVQQAQREYASALATMLEASEHMNKNSRLYDLARANINTARAKVVEAVLANKGWEDKNVEDLLRKVEFELVRHSD